MAGYKLTIRHGPKVTREDHGTLDEAVEALRERVGDVRRQGNLPEVKVFRTYDAGDRVNARLEISTGRMFRSRDAGIDVMGDGALIAFRGGVGRKPIDPIDDESPIESVARVLRG